jgi:hypothetical protein
MAGLLPTVKFATYREYEPHAVALAESALLTVWSGLGAWYDDLVLVGGLVPKYLCGDVAQARALPRPATLDVDFGIALGASAGQYATLSSELAAHGFTRNKDHPNRFETTVGEITIPVDFLVERLPYAQGTAMVDDVVANILPGVDRALAMARRVTVNGVDLGGSPQSLPLRVCEVGPFFALKLRAFARRQQPKDAFDILYTLLHYDRGSAAAVAAFAEEVQEGNPACPEAVECLHRHFSDEGASAPVRAAHFVLGAASPGESPALREQRLRIQQDVVSAGRLLLGALPQRPHGS